jgi:S1-C subfamily serine protease
MNESEHPAGKPTADGTARPAGEPEAAPVPFLDAAERRRRRRRTGRIRGAAALVVVGLVAAGMTLLIAAGGHLGGAQAGQAVLPTSRGVVAPQHPTGRSAIARVDAGLVDISAAFGLAHAQGAATGMVLTPGGLVLTNNHVIQGATRIVATSVATGRPYTATLVGYDSTRDVAVIKLQGARGMATVPLGDSASLRIGERVTALGNAGGAGGVPAASRGAVVALGRAIVAGDAGGPAERLSGMVVTSAHIVGGDSGGPLVDSAGQVVGMDTASSAGSGQAHQPVVGFAIPIDTALSVVRQIESGRSAGTVHVGPTAFLGVALVPTSSASSAATGSQVVGAVVGGLVPGYPAERTGLARGDLITALAGRPVTSAAGLTAVLNGLQPGDVVVLSWTDVAGHAHSASVTLASGPPA